MRSIAEARALIENARTEVRELCHGKKFTMRIPVQVTDSDRVITDGLDVGTSLLDELEATCEWKEDCASGYYGWSSACGFFMPLARHPGDLGINFCPKCRKIVLAGYITVFSEAEKEPQWLHLCERTTLDQALEVYYTALDVETKAEIAIFACCGRNTYMRKPLYHQDNRGGKNGGGE